MFMADRFEARSGPVCTSHTRSTCDRTPACTLVFRVIAIKEGDKSALAENEAVCGCTCSLQHCAGTVVAQLQRWKSPMRHTARACALFLLSLAPMSMSQAQDQPKRAVPAVSAEARLRQEINGNTIGVLGGIMNGTFMRFVDDVAKVIDDGDNLRILPIVGKGGAQNLRDLLYLKGVDLAIISAHSLNEFRNQPGFSNLAERICYVTLLHPEELHIISDKVRSIDELTDKVVAFDGTGSKLAAESLFAPFGIKPKQMLALNLIEH
jgi:hypothetical protein